MATTTFFPAKTVVAPPNRTLRTDPKPMAVSKVWDSLLRGARTIGRATNAYENAALVHDENII